MKYYFILNPAAGSFRTIQDTLYELQLLGQQSDKTIKTVVTERPGHATQMARKIAASGQPARVYACGGDGTLNEVLQGVVGSPHIEVGCVPVGSGNDFIKNFRRPAFLDLSQQLTAPSTPVDVMLATGEFGQRYALNVISLSWDSRVAINVERYKKMPFVKGPAAYGLSVLSELIKRQTTHFAFEIDGEKFPEKEYMIGMCGNGGYYGGGFHGAPFAKLNDGLMELVFVEDLTRRQVARLAPIYLKGTHLTTHKDRFKGIMTYRQAKELHVLSDQPIPITIDGEEAYSPWIRCQILENQVRLIVPPAGWTDSLISE